MKDIHFNIYGETITKLAREFLYKNHDLTKAITFLKESLISDEISEELRLKYVIDILEGRKQLVGMYPDGDYHIEKDNKNLPGIAGLIKNLSKQAETATKKMQQYQMHRNFLICQLTENTPYTAKDYINAYKDEFEEEMLTEEEKKTLGLPLPNVYTNPRVQSFIDRMELDTEDDYGWLEPNGTYHPAEWGEHTEWADNYLKNHLSVEDYMKIFYATDYLISKNWILLHNPAQGIGIPTLDKTKRPTKQQREFLYDYYTERKKPDLAKQWLNDEKTTIVNYYNFAEEKK